MPNKRKTLWLLPHLIIIASLSSSLSPAAAAFGGGSSGAHGGSIVFADGRWQNADLFAGPRNPGEPMQLSPEVKVYLKSLRDVLTNYGLNVAPFFEKHILASNVELRTAERPPCTENELQIPTPGLKQLPVGCTTDSGVTYFIPSRLAKLDFNGKLLALLHERLHALVAWNGGKVTPEIHQQIAGFVDGVAEVLELLEKQSAGKLDPVLPQDVKRIENLNYIQVRLGMSDIPNSYSTSQWYKFWPDDAFYLYVSAFTPPTIAANGGGAVFNCDAGSIDDSAFVGVGSVIACNENHKVSISQSSLMDSYVLIRGEAKIKDIVLKKSTLLLHGPAPVLNYPLRIAALHLEDSDVKISGDTYTRPLLGFDALHQACSLDLVMEITISCTAKESDNE